MSRLPEVFVISLYKYFISDLAGHAALCANTLLLVSKARGLAME